MMGGTFDRYAFISICYLSSPTSVSVSLHFPQFNPRGSLEEFVDLETIPHYHEPNNSCQ